MPKHALPRGVYFGHPWAFAAIGCPSTRGFPSVLDGSRRVRTLSCMARGHIQPCVVCKLFVRVFLMVGAIRFYWRHKAPGPGLLGSIVSLGAVQLPPRESTQGSERRPPGHSHCSIMAWPLFDAFGTWYGWIPAAYSRGVSMPCFDPSANSPGSLLVVFRNLAGELTQCPRRACNAFIL